MPYEVTVAPTGVTIHLFGDIDHHSTRTLLRALDREVAKRMPKRLGLDFGEVTFMDSSGIALVLRLRRQCGELGCALRVENAPPQPRRVFAAAGLDKLVEFC